MALAKTGDRAAVHEFIAGVKSPTRRRDAETLVELIERVTGLEPALWGTIVGFGSYPYTYESGREGDAAAIGFAPRAAATTIYLLDGVGAHEDQLAKLGPHTTGVGCLYIKDLQKVDLDVLSEIIGDTYRALAAGTYGKRARDTSRPDATGTPGTTSSGPTPSGTAA